MFTLLRSLYHPHPSTAAVSLAMTEDTTDITVTVKFLPSSWCSQPCCDWRHYRYHSHYAIPASGTEQSALPWLKTPQTSQSLYHFCLSISCQPCHDWRHYRHHSHCAIPASQLLQSALPWLKTLQTSVTVLFLPLGWSCQPCHDWRHYRHHSHCAIPASQLLQSALPWLKTLQTSVTVLFLPLGWSCQPCHDWRHYRHHSHSDSCLSAVAVSLAMTEDTTDISHCAIPASQLLQSALPWLKTLQTSVTVLFLPLSCCSQPCHDWRHYRHQSLCYSCLSAVAVSLAMTEDTTDITVTVLFLPLN